MRTGGLHVYSNDTWYFYDTCRKSTKLYLSEHPAIMKEIEDKGRANYHLQTDDITA